MIPVAVLDPQIVAITGGVGRQVPFIEQILFAHQFDELWPSQAELVCSLSERAFHCGPPHAACAAGVAAAARWLMDSTTLL